MIKVLSILPGLAMGGAEHMAYELVNNLNKDLFAPYVFCIGGPLNTTLEKQMEAICPVLYGNIHGKISIADFFHVLKSINKINADLVHAHMGGVGFAIPWIWLKRKPLVITIHTKPELSFSKKNDWIIRHSLSKRKIKLIAVSPENQKCVKNFYSVDDTVCEYINNGIDTSRFNRIKHDHFTFINVARQDENKNQAVILRCFEKIHAEYPNTRLLLIGDGPLHSALCQQVEQMNLKDAVVIPGVTDAPEKYYAVSDVYVQSSHREAMPLSVLEAMAAGLPIVTTNVGGLRDVVQDNGILVDDNDANALYEAMVSFIKSDKEFIRTKELASKRIVCNYSSTRMAERYSDIYMSLLDRK